MRAQRNWTAAAFLSSWSFLWSFTVELIGVFFSGFGVEQEGGIRERHRKWQKKAAAKRENGRERAGNREIERRRKREGNKRKSVRERERERKTQIKRDKGVARREKNRPFKSTCFCLISYMSHTNQPIDHSTTLLNPTWWIISLCVSYTTRSLVLCLVFRLIFQNNKKPKMCWNHQSI